MSDGSITIDVQLNTKDFQKDVERVKSEAVSGFGKVEKELKRGADAVSVMEAYVDACADALHAARRELEGFTTAQNGVTTGSAAYAELTEKVKTLERGLESANDSLEQCRKATGLTALAWRAATADLGVLSDDLLASGTRLKELGKSLSDAGEHAVQVTKPLVDFGRSAFEAGAAFEESLSGIAAVTGASAEGMALFKAAAMEAGEATKYSAVESARAIEELAKAGLSSAQILEGGLAGSLTLAAAGGLDVAEAAGIASTVLNAFKDDALSVSDAANILAGAANSAATDVAGINQGLSQVASVASGMGLSFEDTATALALFANNGLKGSDAGTSLKTMLMGLQPTTAAQNREFARLGLLTEEGTSAFYALDGTMRPLNEVAGLLQNALSGLTKQEQAVALEVMFGSDAFRAANVLYKEGKAGVEGLTAALREADAADVAAARMNNLRGQIEELGGKLETLKIRLFDTEKGAMSAIIAKATELVSWFLSLDDKTLQLITTLGIAVAAVGPVAKALGGLTQALGFMSNAAGTVGKAISLLGQNADGATPAVGLLHKAFTALLNPSNLVILALGAITLAVSTFLPECNALKIVLGVLLGALMAYKAATAIKGVLAGIATAMETARRVSLGCAAATEAMTGASWANVAVEKAKALAVGLSALATTGYAAACAVAAGSISIVTAAQWLWNAAFYANPIGAVIAAVAVLTAGVLVLVNALTSQSAEEKAQKKHTEELLALQKEALETAEKSAAAYREETRARELSAERLREDVSTLYALADATDGSAESMAAMAAQVAALNDAVPGLSLAYDDQTGALNLSKEAVLELVEAREAELELNAQIAEQKRLKEEAIDLELKLADVIAQRGEVEKTLEERKADKKGTSTQTKQIKELTAAEEAYTLALAENAAGQSDLSPKIAENTAKVEAAKKARKALEEATKAQQEAEAAWAEKVKAATAALEKAYEGYRKTATNALEVVKAKTLESADGVKLTHDEIRAQMTDTLRANAEFTRVWTDNLRLIEQAGLDPQFLSDLKGMGPEAAEAVAALATATKDEFDAVNDAYRASASAAMEALRKELHLPANVGAGADMVQAMAEKIDRDASLSNAVSGAIARAKTDMDAAQRAADFPQVGADMSAGVVKGISGGAGPVNAAARDLIRGSLRAMRDEAAIHSPSKKTAEVGAYMGEGLIAGAESVLEDVLKAGAALSEHFLAGATGALDDQDWQKQLNDVKTAYQTMSDAVVDALKERYGQEKTLAAAALDERLQQVKDTTEKELEVTKREHEQFIDLLEARKEAEFAALEKRVSDQREASAKIIEQFEREHDALMLALDYDESDETSGLQSQIDALDAMTAAEDKALKAQEDQKRVHDLEQRIQQAETDEDRRKAQIALEDELAKQARAALLDARKAEKESLKAQIAQVKAAYAAQRDAAKADIAQKREDMRQQEADLTAHYNEEKKQLEQKYQDERTLGEKALAETLATIQKRGEAESAGLAKERAQLDAHYAAITQKDRLEAEARRVILAGDQQALVDMLNTYTPGWANAGKSAGDAFLDALQGITPSIEGEVSRIMGLIGQVTTVKAPTATSAPVAAAPQATHTAYTVQKGDTLSAIAAKYGVTVSALRAENGLTPADDTKLQIGRALKIPILHKGGVSEKEQLALIDKSEAVAPLSVLFDMIKDAVGLFSFRHADSASVVTRQKSTQETTLSFTVNYQGEMTYPDVYGMSRALADMTASELRGRGLALV